MAQPTQSDPQFKLRLPADLKRRIEQAAANSNRSMNAEIVSTLEEKYPAQSWAAEDLLDFLGQIAETNSLDEKIAGTDALNQILELYGVGLEAHLEDGAVILLKHGWDKKK